jgi:hypothetical protein
MQGSEPEEEAYQEKAWEVKAWGLQTQLEQAWLGKAGNVTAGVIIRSGLPYGCSSLGGGKPTLFCLTLDNESQRMSKPRKDKATNLEGREGKMHWR